MQDWALVARFGPLAKLAGLERRMDGLALPSMHKVQSLTGVLPHVSVSAYQLRLALI